MQTVKLKNGTEEFDVLVATTMGIMETLFSESPILAYELVMLARDRNHRPWGNAGQSLVARGLLDADMSMHSSIRNIVLSAVTGNDLDMRLNNPIAKKE